MGATDDRSLFERVGGEAFFGHLVDAFYDGVAGDEVLARLYPEHPDFSGARRRLTLFLVQYWGGPATYSQERGHPRLRMRHSPFVIGERERDHWLTHMTAAVDAATDRLVDDGRVDRAERDRLRTELVAYFRPSADHLRNSTGLPITSPSFRA